MTALPQAHTCAAKAPARALDRGMGEAVGRRTVFRPSDQEDFGKVADRVATGNLSLVRNHAQGAFEGEWLKLRNSIATGSLLTSGRHLQHGDPGQASRNLEVYSNCSTSAASFVLFYLLLNGSGVGRSYDDDLMVTDWSNAPSVHFYLSSSHPDYPRTSEAAIRFAIEMGWLPWGSEGNDASWAAYGRLYEEVLDTPNVHGPYELFRIPDSREGWAQALERIEGGAHDGVGPHKHLILDFSDIRPNGSPIAGMQDRPASGPLSLMRAMLNIRRDVIEASRKAPMPLWRQAMLVDHFMSVEVQVGGARRAARMATKSWKDPGIFEFIRCKTEGGMWTANNSVMVDKEFWWGVNDTPGDDHAKRVFDEVTKASYVNGEPGFINGDLLEDARTGFDRKKPVYEDGRDVRSQRYRTSAGSSLLRDAAKAAQTSRFPTTTNPCGEIPLHVTGGVCIIGDFAPVLACPLPFDVVTPGRMSHFDQIAWDHAVRDSVILGTRFLIRVNLMNALYGEEIKRTNRIGIGPTGLHEWAWMRFGLSFRDLLDEKQSHKFWMMLEHLSQSAKQEAKRYSKALGVASPHTVTTIKPAGTTSKLFGLTEGAHLPARRQYLRWVQFKGQKDAGGQWLTGADPLLAAYEAKGYPLRELRTFPGMSIVGFPTVPLLQRLGAANVVTAPEATPEEQYQWLRLLEKYWIGDEHGNQVSYTLKVYTDKVDLASYRELVRREQPTVRCCSVLPSKPDKELGYEYLPEEEVSAGKFAAIVSGIRDGEVSEAVDWAHLQCSSGACPL